MCNASSYFLAHYQRIYRYLVGLTGDADVAADAAQEAFARLIERPPQSTEYLRAWLYRVATNLALDAVRGSNRRSEVLATHPEVFEAAPVPIPDEQFEQAERRRLVRAGLEELRPRERAVLLMRAQGFSYREIAGALDVPMNSIGAIGARGLKKLARYLAPREEQLR